MVRTIMGRRHDVIDLYAPEGEECYDYEMEVLT